MTASPTMVPERRRRVSFADESGQDLATVVEFSAEECTQGTQTSSDEAPTHEIATLVDDDEESRTKAELRRTFHFVKLSSLNTCWMFNFDQPTPYWLMLQRLADQSIALERAVVLKSLGVLVGWIRVNISLLKTRVFVRYTTDDWCTTNERKATYAATSPMGEPGTYAFEIDLREATMNGRLEFELVCSATHEDDDVVREYCDTNSGSGYVVSQQPMSTLVKDGADAHVLCCRWLSS